MEGLLAPQKAKEGGYRGKGWEGNWQKAKRGDTILDHRRNDEKYMDDKTKETKSALETAFN